VNIGPGLHRDLDFATYAALPYVNSGAIKWGMVSMRHMQDSIAGKLESDDTKDRRFGRGAHCCILEGHEAFASRFLVATTCNSQFANGSPCKAPGKWYDGKSWYCGRHKHDDCTEPTEFESIEEGERIKAMADRLHGHPSLAMLKRKGWSELTIVYDRDGVRCKIRIDRAPEDLDICMDVKKGGVGAITDAACMDSIVRYGWHRQAALYVDGIKAHHPLGLEPAFAWVFVEDGYPFGVNVIVADPETIECGRWEVNQVLEQWRRANQYGTFPDYMPDPRHPFVGGLPAWYRKAWAAKKQAMEAA
jgi:hypothetical protein